MTVVTAPEVPWWGLVSSLLAPVLLVGGWTVAGDLQPPSFDPVSDTVSGLMALGASDRWVMTTALLAVGVCYVVTGLALRPAGTAGRLILIGGAVTGMLVAANPATADGTPTWHAVWASLGFAGLAAWPAGAWRRGPSVPWALRAPACFAAVTVQTLLIAWFVADLVLGLGQAGLAERMAGLAQSLEPLAVVLSCRISRPRAAPAAAAGPDGDAARAGVTDLRLWARWTRGPIVGHRERDDGTRAAS